MKKTLGFLFVVISMLVTASAPAAQKKAATEVKSRSSSGLYVIQADDKKGIQFFKK
jgi:hypothetical protein